jgi:hypothetical protein
MFEECASDVRTPNFGESKGRRLTLAKRQLYNIEFHGKCLKAPKLCSQKFDKEVIFI